MKPNNDLDPKTIATLEPTELLKRFANFKQYQLLGKCLGYNPKITACGLADDLDNWDYDAQGVDCQKSLDIWTTSKQAAPQIASLLLDAATPLWGTKPEYRGVLLEIAAHLKLGILTGKTLADFELAITAHLLRKALEAIKKMSQAKQEKLEAELETFLRDHHVLLGGKSAIDFLGAGGAVGLGGLAGTQIVTGIILAHLGIWHGLLFAVGLWAVPTTLIAGAVFAPLTLGALVYILGQHNFKKTIPCVAIIASIRQEAMLRVPAVA